MTHKPDHWTQIDDLSYFDLDASSILANGAGWTFFEHPTEGDEHPVLAVSLDFISNKGPLIFNTHDFDVPEFL